MPEDNDYGCPVCGKHFADEDDYKEHGKYDHPEVNENYPETFNGKDPREIPEEAQEIDWDEIPEEEWDDVVLRKVNGDKEEEPAEEIEKQVDKPIQSHDEWQKELEGLQDELATEQEKCAICDSEDHSTNEHPVTEEGGPGSGKTGDYAPLPEETAHQDNPHYNPYSAEPRPLRDPSTLRTTEDAPEDNLVWDDKTNHYVNKSEEDVDPVKCEDCGADFDSQYVLDKHADIEHGTEDGARGVDSILNKVKDFTESWKYMKREDKARIFESIGITQGDSYALANLGWNNISKPLQIDVVKAYATEQQEPEPKEEDEDEKDENDAYKNFYNLEENHSSPDFKKKDLTCNQCNESFQNINNYHVHYNEVHAREQEYTLPEECPYCHIEINEPDTLDWHMQEEHGAHVPSQFTQTGLQGAMADTDFDSLESKAREGYLGESRVSDLKRERKELANFINIASIENPLNIYNEQEKLRQIDAELASLGESYANEDGMYANFGDKDKDDSWSVFTVASDLLYFNSREDAEDYVKNFPSDTYDISPPKSGRESYAKEGELASYPDEDEYTDSEFGSTRPREQRANEDHEVGQSWQATNPQGETYEYVNELDEDGVGTHITTVRFVGYDNPEGKAEEQAGGRPWTFGKTEKGDTVIVPTRDDDEEESEEGGPGSGRTPEGGRKLEPYEKGGWEPMPEQMGMPKETMQTYDPYTPAKPDYDYKGDIIPMTEAEMPEWFQDPEQREEAEKANAERVKQMQKAEEDDERECEGCGRMEDYLNDDNLCEDCEREAGIDRKESERDAYD